MIFIQNSKWIEIPIFCNSIPVDQIAANYYTCHKNKRSMSRAKFYSAQSIIVSIEQNEHPIEFTSR